MTAGEEFPGMFQVFHEPREIAPASRKTCPVKGLQEIRGQILHDARMPDALVHQLHESLRIPF